MGKFTESTGMSWLGGRDWGTIGKFSTTCEQATAAGGHHPCEEHLSILLSTGVVRSVLGLAKLLQGH